MKWKDAKKKADSETWAELELRPTGKIINRDQYDYVCYYGSNTCIDCRYIKSFEEAKGKYVWLGNWFGGASFYFYFSDKPEGNDSDMIRNKGAIVDYKSCFEEFSYGKFGRIEFE